MSKFQEITFTDADVVNPDDYIPAGEYNPHNVRPFLIHDHGFVLGIAFADCLQDAIDELVDADKLNRFMLNLNDKASGVVTDYMHETPVGEGVEIDGKWYDWNDNVSFLGNAGEPFDIDTIGAIELPIPKFSFCALFDAGRLE